MPSHRRNLKKTFGSSETKGLDIEPLAIEIDKHAKKRLDANQIYGVELKNRQLFAEFMNGKVKLIELSRKKAVNTYELIRVLSLLKGTDSEQILWRTVIAEEITARVERKTMKEQQRSIFILGMTFCPSRSFVFGMTFELRISVLI
ncbi:hypothetical protein ACR2XN_28690 [Klebsiella pneumoniae]